MYKIYADGHLIYYNGYDPLKISNPNLESELNQIGQLKFSIYPEHPYYNKFINSNDPLRIKKMKSIIRVFDDNKLIWRGRILENEEGFYKERQVTCESELAFFLDSKLRPYSETKTPSEMLAYYIEQHNVQMVEPPPRAASKLMQKKSPLPFRNHGSFRG